MTGVKEAARALGVFNSHNLMSKFSGSDPAVMVSYRPRHPGRAPQSAAWQVIHAEHKTGPGGYWRDYGHRTYDVFNREEREPQLQAALSWASERYAVEEWVRGPFGGYHPAGTVARFNAAVKAHQKTTRDAK